MRMARTENNSQHNRSRPKRNRLRQRNQRVAAKKRLLSQCDNEKQSRIYQRITCQRLAMREGLPEEIHPTQPQRHQQRRKRHKAARNTAPKSFSAWTLAQSVVAKRPMVQTGHDGRRGKRSDYNHRVAEQRRPIKRVQPSTNRRSKKTQNFQKRKNNHRKKREPARRKHTR